MFLELFGSTGLLRGGWNEESHLVVVFERQAKRYHLSFAVPEVPH